MDGAGCRCIGLINESLKAHNTQLAVTFVIRPGGGVAAYPTVATELVEKRRGARPMAVAWTQHGTRRTAWATGGRVLAGRGRTISLATGRPLASARH